VHINRKCPLRPLIVAMVGSLGVGVGQACERRWNFSGGRIFPFKSAADLIKCKFQETALSSR
jgi:hypothetical protein